MSANDTKNENPGMVTSDSLAAESILEGGSFGANSDSRGPMDQPSRSTNTNTTDIAGATTLQPAPDAEARAASEEWSESAQLNAGLGLGKDAGRGPTWDTRPSDGDLRDVTNQSAPKGQNINEGGFDSDAPNASFGTDIGGKNDPGRVALERMEASNVPFAGGAGPKDEQISKDGQFDSLRRETDA